MESATTYALAQMLYRAMDSAVGIIVASDNVVALQQRLCQAKTQLGEAVAILNVRRSPDNPEGELWIVKGGAIPEEEFAKKSQREKAIDATIADIIQKI